MSSSHPSSSSSSSSSSSASSSSPSASRGSGGPNSASRRNYFGRRTSPPPSSHQDQQEEGGFPPAVRRSKRIASSAPVVKDGGFQFRVKSRKPEMAVGAEEEAKDEAMEKEASRQKAMADFVRSQDEVMDSLLLTVGGDKDLMTESDESDGGGGAGQRNAAATAAAEKGDTAEGVEEEQEPNQLRRSLRKRKQRGLTLETGGPVQEAGKKKAAQAEASRRRHLARKQKAVTVQAALSFRYPSVNFDPRTAFTGDAAMSSSSSSSRRKRGGRSIRSSVGGEVDEEYFLQYMQYLLDNELQSFRQHCESFRQQQQLRLLEQENELEGNRQKRLKKSGTTAADEDSGAETGVDGGTEDFPTVSQLLQPQDEVFRLLEKQMQRLCEKFLDAYQAQHVIPAVKEARQRVRRAAQQVQPNPKNQHLKKQIHTWNQLLKDINTEIEILERVEEDWKAAGAVVDNLQQLQQQQQQQQQQEGNQHEIQTPFRRLEHIAAVLDRELPGPPGMETELLQQLLLEGGTGPPGLDPAEQEFLAPEKSSAAGLAAALPEAFNYISLRADGIQSSLERLLEVTRQAKLEQERRAEEISRRSLQQRFGPQGQSPKLVKDLIRR